MFVLALAAFEAFRLPDPPVPALATQLCSIPPVEAFGLLEPSCEEDPPSVALPCKRMSWERQGLLWSVGRLLGGGIDWLHIRPLLWWATGYKIVDGGAGGEYAPA